MPDWSATTPTTSQCRQEVIELHEFFVEWYTGQCDDDAFDRVEAALAPGFEMITPDGERVARETVLERVREQRDTYLPGGFDIEIRDCEVTAAGPGFALARYEEWQSSPTDGTGRLSSALLRPDDDAPAGLRWVALQETWLEE